MFSNMISVLSWNIHPNVLRDFIKCKKTFFAQILKRTVGKMFRLWYGTIFVRRWFSWRLRERFKAGACNLPSCVSKRRASNGEVDSKSASAGQWQACRRRMRSPEQLESNQSWEVLFLPIGGRDGGDVGGGHPRGCRHFQEKVQQTSSCSD